MRYAILCLALITAALAQEPKSGQPGSAYARIGAVHREISEKSPVAKLSIEQVPRDPRIMNPFKITIQTRLYDTSDHEINYRRIEIAFDFTDLKTGRRAPETALGCAVNFFSDCYTSHMPMSEANGFGKKPGLTIEPHKYFESKDFVDGFYKLSSGQYSVVAYFCAAEREGPECLRSNKIIISVPAEK